MVSHPGGDPGQAQDAVVTVVKVEDEFVHLAFLRLDAVFGFFLLGFLVILLQEFLDILFFLVPGKLVICFSVEEHDVYVLLRTPAAVAAVAGTVRSPGHRLAAQSPAEIAVGVSAPGQVGDLAGLDFDQGDVGVVPASVRLVLAQQELAVRTPFEAQVPVLVGIQGAREYGFLLAGLEVPDHDVGPVPEVGELLSVGGNGGIGAGDAFRGDPLFLEIEGESEILVFLVGQDSLPDAPAAVALRRIVQFPSVGGETDAALPFRSAGDAAGGLLLHRGDKHVSARNEGDFLAVGRDGDIRGPEGDRAPDLVLDGLILRKRDLQLDGILSFAQGI